MKRFRNEWKYVIPAAMALELREKLAAVMDPDIHARSDGYYRVHSLYFDNIDNTCARENIAGERLRFKYRIRFYDTYDGTLFLERKEKFNSLCYKDSCIISEDEMLALMGRGYGSLMWVDDRKLLARFATDIAREGFTPRSIVDYERSALTEPIHNVRITFDRNVFVSADTAGFTTGDYTCLPAVDSSREILEVKFDDCLPGYITRLLRTGHMDQQAYSKYYNSRVLTAGYYGRK